MKRFASDRVRPIRRLRRWCGAWCWLALVAAGLGAIPMGRAQVRVGDIFPDLKIGGAGAGPGQPGGATAGGATVRGSPPTAATSGDAVDAAVQQVRGKVALIDFWASWCPPCKASFPAYGRIYAEYGPRGLGLLAVSVDEKAAAYAEFVNRLMPPFAVVRDANQSLVQRVQVPTMPTSYLVDRSGRVRYMHTGFRGAETEAVMRKEIETLLAEPAS